MRVDGTSGGKPCRVCSWGGQTVVWDDAPNSWVWCTVHSRSDETFIPSPCGQWATAGLTAGTPTHATDED